MILIVVIGAESFEPNGEGWDRNEPRINPAESEPGHEDQRRPTARQPGHPLRAAAYDVAPDDLAAETVARKIGLPPEQVFKTLIARGTTHGVCLAVVPGDTQLDLKALAKASGDKKVNTVPSRKSSR